MDMAGPDHSSRHARDGAMGGDVGYDHASGTDPGTPADLHVPEDHGARTEQDTGADLRVTVARFLTRRAERHAVEDGHVVADDRGLPDDYAGGVVHQDAHAQPRGRVDVD